MKLGPLSEWRDPLWQMQIGLPRVYVLLKKIEENQNIDIYDATHKCRF